MNGHTHNKSKLISLYSKALCALLALVIAVVLMPWGGIKAKAEESGAVSDTISYTIDHDSGLLTLSGTGTIPDDAIHSSLNDVYRNHPIRKIVIGEGITGIGNRAFENVSNLKIVELPDGLNTIGMDAFSGCGSLETVNFPQSLTSIGSYAFDRTHLKSVTIPSQITDIRQKTFTQCLFTEITIPANVSRMEYEALSPNENLKTITFTGDSITVYDFGSNTKQLSFGSGNLKEDVTVRIPSGFMVNGTVITCENVSNYFGNAKVTNIHQLTKHDEVAATCLENGTKEYWTCDDCGKMFSDEAGLNVIDAPEVISAAGHNMTEVPKKDPTCIEAGNIEHWKCSVCEKYFSDESGTSELTEEEITIPPLGHKWGGWNVDTAAACEIKGKEKRECTVCHTAETRDTDPLGHKWDEGKVTKEATRHETGVMTYTCSNDSTHTKTEEIPKITDENGYAFVTKDHKYSLRSEKTVEMTVQRGTADDKTFDNFEELLIDGNVIPESAYTKEKGSVKITLKSSYLDKLSKGTHTVRVNFVNGYAESTLKITSAGSGSTPGTGDDTKVNNLVSSMILFMLSLSIVLYSIYSNDHARTKLLAAFYGTSSASLEGAADDGFEDIIPEDQTDDGFEDIISDIINDDGFEDIISDNNTKQ